MIVVNCLRHRLKEAIFRYAVIIIIIKVSGYFSSNLLIIFTMNNMNDAIVEIIHEKLFKKISNLY